MKAGQQIGLTASSGNSAGPHLHWEVQDSAVAKEPWAGPCRPGPSLFTNQPAYDGALYVRDFAFSRTAPTAADSYPFPGPRCSHFAMTDGNLYFWILVNNVPANQAYTVRFKRPDGSLVVSERAVAAQQPGLGLRVVVVQLVRLRDAHDPRHLDARVRAQRERRA